MIGVGQVSGGGLSRLAAFYWSRIGVLGVFREVLV